MPRRLLTARFQQARATLDMLHNTTLSSLALGSLGGRPAHRPARRGRAATEQALFAAQQASLLGLGLSSGVAACSSCRGEGQSDTASQLPARRPNCSDPAQDIPVEYGQAALPIGRPLGPHLEFTDSSLRSESQRRSKAPPLDQGGAGCDRATQGDRVAGLFPRFRVTNFEAKQRSIEKIAPGTAISFYPISLPDRLEIIVSFGAAATAVHDRRLGNKSARKRFDASGSC